MEAGEHLDRGQDGDALVLPEHDKMAVPGDDDFRPRSNGGRHPVSKTGVPAKGGITRSPRKNSEKLILRRRKFGKFQQRPQTVNV